MVSSHPPVKDIDRHPEGYPDHSDELPEGPAGFPVMNGDELCPGRLETPVEQPGIQNTAIITPFPAFNLAQQYYNKNASLESADIVGQQAVRTGKLDEKAKTFKMPADRHYYNRINAKSAVKKETTVIDPRYKEDVEFEIAQIQSGNVVRVGESWEINGRTYTYHDERFVPVSGPGFIKLDRVEYTVLKIYKIYGISKDAEMNIERRGISKDVSKKVKDIYIELDSNGNKLIRGIQ